MLRLLQHQNKIQNKQFVDYYLICGKNSHDVAKASLFKALA